MNEQKDVYLGPYYLQLVDQFLAKAHPKDNGLEKISLWKMEYFLVGIREAHKIIM